jgi:thiol-disulfide isomerase/thioredoxin
MSVTRGAGIALGLVLLLAGCTDASSDVESGGGQGFVSGDGSAQVIAPEDRTAAPAVAGTTLDGEPLALSDFAGDVVVVNVWGSWCAPCRAEAEALQQVYLDHRQDGVQFVGLNTRDQQAAALAFEERFGITYPSLVDENGELQLAFRDSLPPNAIPSTLVIDRDGDIAARVVGPTTYSQLSDLVGDVAAET